MRRGVGSNGTVALAALTTLAFGSQNGIRTRFIVCGLSSIRNVKDGIPRN
jgi:hypothetical protein